MTRALIIKELRQHWLAFLLSVGLCGLGALLLILVAATGDGGSWFEVLKTFLQTFYVVLALVVCNRLVVREYQSKTQLFLEVLPVSRLRMVAVKYMFGLLFLFSLLTFLIAVLVLLSLRNEQLTTRFLLILTACSFAYAWCVYSFFFVMGFFGRYRIPIYLLSLIGAMFVEIMTNIEWSQFGPFALLDDRFGFERVTWPTDPLLASVGIAATFVCLTLMLSLLREGGIAALLAEKMSHREKVFVTVLLIGVVSGVAAFDERVAKQPFDLPGAVAARVDGVTVKVSAGTDAQKERGRRLAEVLASDIAALQRYLQIPQLPAVFVVQRTDLDANRYERGDLDGAEGLLVRANFLSDAWQQERFQSWLVRELLIMASEGRVQYEPNRWVMDGFALYWTCRDAKSRNLDYQRLELRAAYGGQQGFSSADAAAWLTYRDRVGEDIASAVAWYGLISLHDEQGEMACRAFLRSMLDCGIPSDIRAVWHEWRDPLPAIMLRETDLSYDDFFRTWSDRLTALERQRAGDLTDLPQLSGMLDFESLSTLTRTVKFEFNCDPPPRRFTLLHAELGPIDDEVPVSQIRREELNYRDQRTGDLPRTYARGTRLYWTFAVWVDQLKCEIISGWKRQEMR